MLFISGPGRSGTTLLRDLLDGHPQLAVWPNEWQFITLYRSYVTRDLSDKIPVSKILTCFLKEENKFTPVLEGSVSDHRLQNEDKRFLKLNPTFAKNLWAIKDRKVNAREFYYIVGNSFKWLNSQDIFCNKCNDPENIMHYLSYFREASFLFIIRDPIESYISKLKHRAKIYALVDSSFTHSIPLSSFLEIKEFFKVVQVITSMPDLFENVLILKMEHLLDNPIKKLENIVHFLGISYNDSLTNLTFFGEPVPGYFVDPKENADQILPKEVTIDRKAGLTINEKKWFSYHSDLFLPFYPDIEEKINKVDTVSLFARSYKYFRKYQDIKKTLWLHKKMAMQVMKDLRSLWI